MARKGQFKRGGGRVGDGHARSSRKRSSSRALTVYRPKPVVVTRTRTKTVKVRSKSGGGRSVMKREHGVGEMIPGPFRQKSMAIAGVVGYSEAGKGLTMVQDVLNKIPAIGKAPKEAIAGLVLNYFGDRGDWYDAGAQALLDIGAYKLGQQGFSLSGDDDDD